MDERQVIVGGLSAAVVTAFDTGLDAAAVRAQLIGMMAKLGVAGDASVLDDMAGDIDSGPRYSANWIAYFMRQGEGKVSGSCWGHRLSA